MSFNPLTLGGKLTTPQSVPGIAPKGGLLGGGGGSTGGSGMVGSSERGRSRFMLRNAWNGIAWNGQVNGHGVSLTPFRKVNNAGDLLSREHYVCGGSNQVNNVRRASNAGWKNLAGAINDRCDNTNVIGATCNPKYVYDSSDYIRYKKLRAKNKNYNDYSFGGSNNGAYVALMAVRRF